MKKVYVTLIEFLIIFLISLEIISRILVDPLYFNSINTYDLDDNENIYADYFKSKHTEHVDYLFIGCSRVPASINPKILMHNDTGSIAVVAGRGYMTPGIHIQAIENRLAQYPDFLKGSNVFLGYAGSSIYTDLYSDDRLKVYEPEFYSSAKPMPHLMLPHLSETGIKTYLKNSKNETKVKREMFLLYVSATARCARFLKEKINEKLKGFLNIQPEQNNTTLTGDGGIRNDGLELVIEQAIKAAKHDRQTIIDSPELTHETIDSSSFAYLYNLIKKNGGELYLYELPLHTIQQEIYTSGRAKKNKNIFNNWLQEKGVKVIKNNGFNFNNEDFPDIWHLRNTRRDEFSQVLYQNFINVR